MTALDVLRRVVVALDRAGIVYMLTGSFASAYHGAARATQDIDVVISATPDQLRSLADSLPASEYHFDLKAALEARLREGVVSVIELASGWKIDLIARKSREYSRVEFDRRYVVDFEGMRFCIASAEDVLIAKLEWAKLSGSERQIEDVAGILRTRSGDLDVGYIETWVPRLGLEEQWRAAREAAGAG